MLHPYVGLITLGIYAVLLAVGGIMGFVKARSHASLITGLASALAAVAALVLKYSDVSFGIPLGLLLSTALFVFFGYRFALRGRRFMPAGLMAVVSLVVTMILLVVVADNQ